jgi:hypothetical protein
MYRLGKTCFPFCLPRVVHVFSRVDLDLYVLLVRLAEMWKWHLIFDIVDQRE